MLTQKEIVPYLLRQRLLSTKQIVEGDFIVKDTSQRNCNFAVISHLGPCYLLKQGVGTKRIATVAHEAAIYQLLQNELKTHPFSRYLPRFYEYNSTEHILILELVDTAQNLRQYHSRQGRFPKNLAQSTGQALATLHHLNNMEECQKILNKSLPTLMHEVPWIFSLHYPHLRLFREISSANLQLIKIIQQFPEFCESLERLRQEWQAEALIHRDIKWDNCIVAKTSGSKKTEFKLIDWELASIGDPCWDIGSVFNDYLSFWLLSIPITGEAPPEQFLELAKYPLEKMQPAIRSFWYSYVQQMELDDNTARRWLLKAVRYGAARLVQTAFEQMQRSMQLTGNVVCFLQLSINILQRPQEAAVHLLGIPLQ